MAQEQGLTTGTTGAEEAAAAAAAALASSDGDGDAEQQFVAAASKQGWKPKEEYDGDPEEWVEAKVFLERAQQINPILRAKNQRLERALEDRDRRLQALENTVEGFKRNTVSEVRKTLEIDLAKLRAERAEAIRDGDGDKVNDLDDKMYETRKKLDTAASPPDGNVQRPEPPQELQNAAKAFAENFSWYGKDRYKTGVAHLTASDVREDRPDLLDTPAFFDEVAKRVRARLNERDTRGNIVDGSGQRGNGSMGGTKNYNHLPADVKEICDKQVEQKLFKDRTEFVKYYFEQEGV